MNEIAFPLTQFVLTACLVWWMLSAVYSNWRFPGLNPEAAAMVMKFDLMEVTNPKEYAVGCHRKIGNSSMINAVVGLMVLMETVAAMLLVVGAFLLFACLFCWVFSDISTFVAFTGALAFVLTWTGFLIGGEYFWYWSCHFDQQATHMMLAIWARAAAETGGVLTGYTYDGKRSLESTGGSA